MFSQGFAIDFSQWDKNFDIEICASTDLNKGDLIWVKNINWADFNPNDAGLGDIIVFDHNADLELNRTTEGTSTSEDGNLFFALNNSLSKGTCTTTTYSIHGGNASAFLRDNNATNIEDFESYDDGQALPFGKWYDNGDYTDFSAGNFKSGSQAMILRAGPSLYAEYNFNESFPKYDFNHGFRNADYNVWIFPEQTTSTITISIHGRLDGTETVDDILGAFFNTSGQILDITNAGNIVLADYDVNAWYKISFDYDWNSNEHNTCIYGGTDTNLINCTGTVTNKNGGRQGIPTKIRANLGEAGRFWVDDFTFFAPYETNVVLTTNVVPDVNLVSPFQLIDANSHRKPNTDLNIILTVTDIDNNADSLLFDINLTTASIMDGSIVSGGIVLTNDWNGAGCDSNDLHPASGIGTACIIQVTLPNYSEDANFFIKIDTNDGTDTNTVYSDFNFMIDATGPIETWNLDGNAWHKENKSMAISCDDNGACDNSYYRFCRIPTGSSTCTMGTWQTYTNLVVIGTFGDGNYWVDFNSQDIAGNYSDRNVQYLWIDKTLPTISADNNSTWNLLGDANIHLTCTDTTSGDSNTWYRIDDHNMSDVNWQGADWIQYDDLNIFITDNNYEDGNFVIAAHCIDKAGNDTNSIADVNGTYFPVLLEVGRPPAPDSITPVSGSYIGTVTVTCGVRNWIRDANVVIDVNRTDIAGDWNQIYNNTSTSFVHKIADYSINEKLSYRCRLIDPDKNSLDLNANTSILVNEDTGFDTINTATPLTAEVITTASAPFSVYCSDDSGTAYSRFTIYKLVSGGAGYVRQGDFNGVSPGTDTGNGTWTYTYKSIATGDKVYADINCTDKQVNTSATISSATYTADIAVAPPPIGGGGGGFVPTITIVVPSLVTLITNTDVISLYKGQEKIWKITVESLSDSDIPIEFELPDSLKEFVFKKEFCRTALECRKMSRIEIVAPKQTSFWQYSFRMPVDMNFFENFSEQVLVNLNNGQEYAELQLSLQFVPAAPVWEQTIFGVPIWMLFALFGFLGAVYWGYKKV